MDVEKKFILDSNALIASGKVMRRCMYDNMYRVFIIESEMFLLSLLIHQTKHCDQSKKRKKKKSQLHNLTLI